jgi:polyisoprenyl-phosphate glycosyltransferase
VSQPSTIATAGLVPRSRAGKRLSLVAPFFNEEAGLGLFFDRIEAATKDLGVALEIICIDDGSRDETLQGLIDRAAGDPRVKVIAFARNFGKEAALTAGIEAATGDMVAPIDSDLQDPPELLADFVRLWEEGYDVVYGARADRSSDSAMKRTTAQLFYRVFNRVSDLKIPESAGDFRLMDRQVVEALKELPERNRFMKGLFAWVGFRQIGVPYVRPERAAGVTTMGFFRLWRFALDGITAFSSAPLRMWTGLGLAAAIVAVIAAVALIVRVLIFGREAPGYASLMVVMLFSFAFQMIAFGVLGEYVGRLYQEVKGRPIYVVRARIGFE